jgi:RNA polymerase sigma factor (sigma-70 family)
VILGTILRPQALSFTAQSFIKNSSWGWLVDGESRRGRGPLMAWQISFREKIKAGDLELTGNGASPQSQEYNSGHADSSVPCHHRIPLDEAQRGLAVRYLPMAHQLAQRLCAIWPADREEVHSTAYLALAEAAHAFDSSRKVGFGTFARHRIRAALRDLQRLLSVDGWQGRCIEGPARTELSRLHDRISRGLDQAPDQSMLAASEEAEAVDEWLQGLPKTHAAVCRFIYQGGKSEEEVAIELGCSQSMLSRVHREAVKGLIRAYHGSRLVRPPELDKAAG